MKHVHAIEYRNKTEPPTEPGWYYVRVRRDSACEIAPMYLDVAERFWFEDYDFFGPVAECREG